MTNKKTTLKSKKREVTIMKNFKENFKKIMTSKGICIIALVCCVLSLMINTFIIYSTGFEWLRFTIISTNLANVILWALIIRRDNNKNKIDRKA